MKIYYKNKLIFENIEKNEIEQKINEYIEKEKTKYKDLYEKIENLIKNIRNIRPKEIGESKTEYFDFLEKEYPTILEELNCIGKTYYEEDFKGSYFYDSDGMFLGLLYKNKNNELDNISLHPLLIEIPLKLYKLKRSEFEIKEDV